MKEPDQTLVNIITALVIIIMIVGIAIGHSLGFSRGCSETERKAIDAGVAYYEHSPTSVSGTFKYKTCKE